MLSVIMLSVIIMKFIMLSVIMLSIIILSIILLRIVAPCLQLEPAKIAISNRIWLLLVDFFFAIGTCGQYYKTFRIVIYDSNDSTIVEPVLY